MVCTGRNFENRVARALDVCPALALSEFTYGNIDEGDGEQMQAMLKWLNRSPLAILAIEFTLFRLGPFDEALPPIRFLALGRRFDDWRALEPGAWNQDGAVGPVEIALVALVYASRVRFADGSAWRLDAAGEAIVTSQIDALRELAFKPPG